MISFDEFKNYLSTIVSQEDIEKANSKTLLISLIASAVLIVSFVFVFLAFTMEQSIVFVLLAVLFAIIALVISLSRRTTAYKVLEKKYKGKVLDYLLKGFAYEYKERGKIAMSVFEESQIASKFDTYEGEDLLTLNIPDNNGNVSDTNLIISDLYVTDTEYNHENKPKTVVRFKGVLGCIRFPFEFKYRMTINRNNYAVLEGLDKVELESIDFNKKFSVRCSDQIEARYILTTDMMAKLLAIHAKEKNIQLVLDKDTMFISIPNRNLFSLKVNTKKIDEKAFYLFYEDISLLLSIVEEIKNNDKIFNM